MLATADFDAMAMSEIATEAAVRHLRGERVPAEIILPVQVIDAANCAAWNVPFEKGRARSGRRFLDCRPREGGDP